MLPTRALLIRSSRTVHLIVAPLPLSLTRSISPLARAETDSRPGRTKAAQLSNVPLLPAHIEPNIYTVGPIIRFFKSESWA